MYAKLIVKTFIVILSYFVILIFRIYHTSKFEFNSHVSKLQMKHEQEIPLSEKFCWIPRTT